MLIRKGNEEEMLKLWGYQDRDSASPTARFFYDDLSSGNAVFWTIEHENDLIGELRLRPIGIEVLDTQHNIAASLLRSKRGNHE